MQNQYQVITSSLLTDLSVQAKNTERKRKNYNLHQLSDNVQRFLNAVEPDSYVRPHRHIHPPKNETFIALKGNFFVVIFNDSGAIDNVIKISRDENSVGIDILAGIWHTVISTVSGSVYFEVKDGPYIQQTDKDFASWAPAENSMESKHYLITLKNEAEIILNK